MTDSNTVHGQVSIEAGTLFELPVSAYPGCACSWSFSSSNGDIAFGCTFKVDRASARRFPPNPAKFDVEDDDSSGGLEAYETDREEVSLAEMRRYDADEKEVLGMIRCAKQGTLTLKWDNTFSYFAAKTLKYAVELEEPIGGPYGPRAMGGMQTPVVVFVLGGPGAGKGTQCKKMAENFGFFHVSAGDLLREERENPESEHGHLITEHIQQGKIVPVDITVALLWKAIRYSGRRAILVDGFPRNKDNLEGWQRRVGNKAEVICALDFQVPDEVLIERLTKRGQNSRRDDDNLETIRKRLNTFHQETQPIAWYFEQKDALVKMDGNRPSDVVFEDLCAKLKAKMNVQNLPLHDEYILAAPRNRISPRVILGTMTFGGPHGLNQEAAKELLREFSSEPGCDEIDTARMYAKGETEKLLGSIVVRGKTRIASKANPFIGDGENLTPASVAQQLKESLAALKTDCVDIYYLHGPDANTPLEETLEACDAFYRRGMFKELGLSNFPAWQVTNAYHVCKSRGWVVPTVYQGMYNAITRSVEKELFPALRALNIRFYAYNPLAGGLLTHKYTNVAKPPAGGGRLGADTPMGEWYRQRYWRPLYLKAISNLDKVCKEFNITLQDASLRWMAHHSLLRTKRDDGIIVGVTNLDQLKSNMFSISRAGPLPLPVVVAFNDAWMICKADTPDYFR